MVNNININGLTLKHILDLYSSDKLRRTIAGGTFSARMGGGMFGDPGRPPLPGRGRDIRLDGDALAAVVARMIDQIE